LSSTLTFLSHARRDDFIRVLAWCCESLSCTPRPEMDHTHAVTELSDMLRSHNCEYSVPGVQTTSSPSCRSTRQIGGMRKRFQDQDSGIRMYLNKATRKWPIRPVIREDAKAQACGRLSCVAGPCLRCMALKKRGVASVLTGGLK
jgi:hypothetical protein